MLLGFKRQFAPFVENGTKTHTIRAERKIRPHVGEICHCYTGLRTKNARLLGRWPCVKVQEIVMEWLALDARLRRGGLTLLITIDGVELDHVEANILAWRDGFRSRGHMGALGEMQSYWHQLHGHEAFPFRGHVIHWKR